MSICLQRSWCLKSFFFFSFFAIFYQKYLSAAWFCEFLNFLLLNFFFNWFIYFNNKPFDQQGIRLFCCLVKGMLQTISFHGFFWTVLFLFNRGDQGPHEIVTYSPRSICLQRLAAHSVNLFLVDSVFFHLGEIKFT